MSRPKKILWIPNRKALTEAIIQKANLPKSKRTSGYFTLEQLRVLSLNLDYIKDKDRDRQSSKSQEPEGV